MPITTVPSITLVGDHRILDELEQLRSLERTRLLVLDLERMANERDLSAASTALVQQLRSDAAAGLFEQTRTLVIAAYKRDRSDEEEAFRTASVYSLRGFIQSITREFAHKLEPLNLLIIDRADTAAAKDTLDYLDDPFGGYTAGFTLDITTGAHA